MIQKSVLKSSIIRCKFEIFCCEFDNLPESWLQQAALGKTRSFGHQILRRRSDYKKFCDDESHKGKSSVCRIFGTHPVETDLLLLKCDSKYLFFDRFVAMDT